MKAKEHQNHIVTATSTNAFLEFTAKKARIDRWMEHQMDLPEDAMVTDAQCSTQDSIAPEDSVSVLMDSITAQERSLLKSFVAGCWARPCFSQVLEYDFRANKEITKWQCKICSKTLIYHFKTTTNIRNHLHSLHRNLAMLLVSRSEGLPKRSATSSPQRTRSDKTGKVIQWTEDGLLKRLMQHCLVIDPSCRIVEHSSFVDLMEYCVPGIALPNRKTVKEAMIAKYEEEKIQKILMLQKVHG
jgi:hypothetical protein